MFSDHHHHHLPSTPATAQRYETLRRMRTRGAVILFMCLLALGMGQSLFFAVLPPIARDIGLSEFETSVIFSLSAALWVICSPIWGRKSDVWGRKPVIIIGISGFALSTLLFAITIAMALGSMIAPFFVLPALMAARAVFGSFGCAALPASFAYIADRTSRAQRTRGAATISSAFGIGNVAGPGAAALLVIFGVLTPFLFISALAFICAVALLFFLPERIKPEFKSEEHGVALKDARDTAPLLIVGLLFSFSQAVLIQLSAFYFMDSLDLPADPSSIQLIGAALTTMALAHIFSQLLIIQTGWFSVQFLLFAGMLGAASGFALMAYGTSYFTLASALAICGFTAGFVRAGLMSAGSLLARPGHQGSVAGMLHATAAAGHFLNPFTGVLLYQIDHRYPYLVAASLLVSAAAIVLLNRKIRTLKEQDSPDEALTLSAPHVARH